MARNTKDCRFVCLVEDKFEGTWAQPPRPLPTWTSRTPIPCRWRDEYQGETDLAFSYTAAIHATATHAGKLELRAIATSGSDARGRRASEPHLHQCCEDACGHMATRVSENKLLSQTSSRQTGAASLPATCCCVSSHWWAPPGSVQYGRSPGSDSMVDHDSIVGSANLESDASTCTPRGACSARPAIATAALRCWRRSCPHLSVLNEGP